MEQRETITMDPNTITLGELAAAETASGLDSSILLSRTAHRLLLMVFVHRLRNSGRPPNWSELGNLRVQDAPSLTLDSSPDSPGATSPD